MSVIIQKAPETMTAKERVQRTFAREKTDRVPIDTAFNPGILTRVADALGVERTDYEGVLEALGVDFRYMLPQYTGPQIYPEKPNRTVDPTYGFYTRWVPHEGGGYMDFCDFPLKDAEPEQIAAFPVPSADYFNYDEREDYYRAHKDYALYLGNAGIADIINSIGRVMSMEDTLVNLFTEEEATLDLMNRKVDMEVGVMERMLERCGDIIDFVWLGEDLGTQIGPMISLDTYRKVLRPVHQKFIDLAKSYNKPVMFHNCGSSSWVYPDFIEMGVNAVDTLQPEATNMNPEYLMKNFGDKLIFHGCISTAGPLSFGTPADVRQQVADTLKIMMPGRGYMLAPTHAIQDNSPTENVLEMYQAAHDLGRY